MRRELPPFPENRKIREGGEDFYLYWTLMLLPLVALMTGGVSVLIVCLLS